MSTQVRQSSGDLKLYKSRPEFSEFRNPVKNPFWTDPDLLPVWGEKGKGRLPVRSVHIDASKTAATRTSAFAWWFRPT